MEFITAERINKNDFFYGESLTVTRRTEIIQPIILAGTPVGFLHEFGHAPVKANPLSHTPFSVWLKEPAERFELNVLLKTEQIEKLREAVPTVLGSDSQDDDELFIVHVNTLKEFKNLLKAGIEKNIFKLPVKPVLPFGLVKLLYSYSENKPKPFLNRSFKMKDFRTFVNNEADRKTRQGYSIDETEQMKIYSDILKNFIEYLNYEH